MAVFDTYTQGTPNWVELVTPDQRGAAEFYGALFGWQMVENPLDDGHVYIVGSLQGDAVAGITFQLPELAGHPAFWNVFLAADDVDAVAARVGPAGGVVEAEPVDFFDFGRTARIQDPTGARVGLWQPRSTQTVRANEPGTPIWNELLTPDIGRASQFYSDVLGVSADTHPVPWATVPTYTTFSSAGRQVAGVAPVADGALEEAPPHWNVYFNVVDADESVAQAEALGAKLIVPAYDLEGTGRMATLTDPHGALFCLMAS
jgi:predicted enzyme related to lactoylglutathione lyase